MADEQWRLYVGRQLGNGSVKSHPQSRVTRLFKRPSVSKESDVFRIIILRGRSRLFAGRRALLRALLIAPALLFITPVSAQPAAKSPGLSPMDYPLSPSAKTGQPAPQLPQPSKSGTIAATPKPVRPQPWKQPGQSPPTPTIGNRLPVSSSTSPPELLQERQRGTSPVISRPALLRATGK